MSTAPQTPWAVQCGESSLQRPGECDDVELVPVTHPRTVTGYNQLTRIPRHRSLSTAAECINVCMNRRGCVCRMLSRVAAVVPNPRNPYCGVVTPRVRGNSWQQVVQYLTQLSHAEYSRTPKWLPC